MTFARDTATTTATTTTQTTLTMADLERMADVLREVAPEPIGEWMRARGTPPERWQLILPQRLRDEFDGPMFWPSYVSFSPYVDKPALVARDVLAWPQP